MKARAVAWLVLAASCLLILGGLGQMPLTDRDEGEYAACVEEMARRGDFVLPTLNARPYLEKPILIFWTIRAGRAVLGPGELTARLPSALAAIALVAVVMWLVRLGGGSWQWAAGAGAAMAFSPLSLLLARACLTDMLLTLFTTLALVLGWAASELDNAKKAWAARVGAWASLGLGFLTKGPVALGVVLPAMGVYLLASRRLLGELSSWAHLVGLGVAAAINLPWFLAADAASGGKVWEAFFVAQNIRRFSEVLLGHGAGTWFYPVVLLVGTFPFCAPMAAGALKAMRRGWQASAEGRMRALCLIGLGWCVVLFSLAATKQPNYIAPALPLGAVLAGWIMAEGALGRVGWGVLVGVGVVVVGLLGAAQWAVERFWPMVLASVRPDSTEYAFPPVAPSLGGWGWWAAAAATACILAPALIRRHWPLALAGTGALTSAVVIVGLLGHVAGILQAPAKTMALELKARMGPTTQVLTYGLWKPSLIFYTQRVVRHVRVEQLNTLRPLLESPTPVVLMTRTKLAGRLEARGWIILQRWGPYTAVGNPPAVEAWRQPGRGQPR